MNKKAMLQTTIILSLLLSTVFVLSSNGFAAAKKLKLSHSYETITDFHKGAVWAAQEIGKRTNGRYKVDVFPSGTLGNEREVEEALSMGTVDIGFVGPGHMAQTYAPISLHLAAFLWRDIDHFKMYPQTNAYKELTSEYTKRSGNQIVSLTYFGQRHVTSKKLLTKPEDFKGLKMRVPPLPVYMIFPKAVGASATPIAFSELYLALQQGVVVAQENPLPTIRAKKFYEVQAYIILTGHMTDGFFTLIGGPIWKKLSEADRKIFSEVFEETARKTTDDIVADEKELVAWFESQGTKVIEVDRKPFMKAVEGKLTGKDLPWKQEHIDEILALGK